MVVTRGRPAPRAITASTPPASTNGALAPQFSRERILAYGKEGTGKTNDWFSVADALPDVPFFVIDTDDSAQRLIETDYGHLTNVHVAVAGTWKEFEDAVKSYLPRIREYVKLKPPTRKEDYPWLVIDFADATWDMVQNHFTEQVFDKGIDEYYLLARKNLKGGQLQPLEGWTDWQVINKLFQALWKEITLGGGPFHLYITAKATEVRGVEGKSLYTTLKMMPGGEKRMAYRVHTVLMKSVDSKGWHLSSAKDRGRTLLRDVQVMNFYVTYLRRVAGWEA